MSRVLFCGFKPISCIENYFRAPILDKGDKLYVAGHVYDVKETDGADLRAPSVTLSKGNKCTTFPCR